MSCSVEKGTCRWQSLNQTLLAFSNKFALLLTFETNCFATSTGSSPHVSSSARNVLQTNKEIKFLEAQKLVAGNEISDKANSSILIILYM